MPYIDPEDRDELEAPLRELANRLLCPGDLNYIVCSLLSMALNGEHSTPHSVTYEDLSKWRAAVLDASDEFYRRVMVPYENNKRGRNGDVFDEVLTRLYK